MSNKVSTTFGKAFLWFIAVAVACLIEGALITTSSWFPNAAYAVDATPRLEEVGVAPKVEVDATRLIRFVGAAIELARSTR